MSWYINTQSRVSQDRFFLTRTNTKDMRDNSEDANMRDADMSPSDRKEESAVALANGGTQPGPSHEDETHANQVDTMITDARTENKDRTLKEFLGMMDQYAPIVFIQRAPLNT